MKVSKHLTDRQFCGKYPIEYNLYYQRISKKSRVGQILKKKRYELQLAKISSRWSVFWDVIEDVSPECCFICGYYIRPSQKIDPVVKRPFKNGDICHVDCYNKNIKMEHVTQKLNPKSTLICHIQRPSLTNQNVCRDRIYNDPLSILKHFNHHSIHELQIPNNDSDSIKFFLKQFREDWTQFRNKNFLKPTGEPFKR